jgi:hypothetical protein
MLLLINDTLHELNYLKFNLLSLVYMKKSKSYAELEIDTNEELEGMSYDEFDIDESATFEVEVKANENLKVEKEN